MRFAFLFALVALPLFALPSGAGARTQVYYFHDWATPYTLMDVAAAGHVYRVPVATNCTVTVNNRPATLADLRYGYLLTLTVGEFGVTHVAAWHDPGPG